MKWDGRVKDNNEEDHTEARRWLLWTRRSNEARRCLLWLWLTRSAESRGRRLTGSTEAGRRLLLARRSTEAWRTRRRCARESELRWLLSGRWLTGWAPPRPLRRRLL